MFWQIIFFLSSSHALQRNLQEPTCNTQGTSRTIRLYLNSTRQSTGDWMDSLSAWTEFNNSSSAAQMDIAHTITECQGKRIINIQALNQAPMHKNTEDRLRFHPRCGKNVAVLNKGLTLQKLTFEDRLNAIAFTNRPLKDEEMFEVKMEGRKHTSGYDIGIGIMTKSPTDIDILDEMFKSPFVWIYHDIRLYNGGKDVQRNIGKGTGGCMVGDRVGVMRSEMGTLHFFYNGKDQGPAMSNVPENVYGVLDLRGSFEKASIV